MPQSRTHQDSEQIADPAAAEGVSRNVHGQSLDDAREAFRVEWQGKIDRKRQQAEQARRRKMRWDAARPTLYCGGIVVITYFSLWYSVRLETIVAAPLLVIILTLISRRMRLRSACLEREVQDLEQEVQELEHS